MLMHNRVAKKSATQMGFLIAISLTLLAGCQSTPGTQQASPSTQDASHKHTSPTQEGVKQTGAKEVTYTATLSDPTCGSEVVLIGYMTQIQLESNPTTGYSWRLSKQPALFDLAKDEYKPAAKQPNVVGSGGTQVITLRAKQQGEEILKFEYVRPWEKDVAPVKTQVCKVKIVA